MLKLNASSSKKVPADGEYTSQSYHASIEVELPDGLSAEQLNGKIHETFEMVRSSVEAELHGKSPCSGSMFIPKRSHRPSTTTIRFVPITSLIASYRWRTRSKKALSVVTSILTKPGLAVANVHTLTVAKSGVIRPA